MRIITGKYKGHHFDIPRSFKARPTTDFAKENIFNVLNGYMDLEGTTALDLFAGTGSITLELISRGCSRVVCVEADRDHHRFICDCLTKLGWKAEGGRTGRNTSVAGQTVQSATAEQTQESTVPSFPDVIPLRGDVFRFIKGSHQQFDFIFADPPYALDKLSSIPDLVFANNLLKPDGIFVFEHGKNNDFSHHPHFVEHRTYGSVNFSLFRV